MITSQEKQIADFMVKIIELGVKGNISPNIFMSALMNLQVRISAANNISLEDFTSESKRMIHIYGEQFDPEFNNDN